MADIDSCNSVIVKRKKLHKIVGLILCLPLLAWALTGVVFLTKPGYQEAYDLLVPKSYALHSGFSVPSSSAWQEVRMLRTILGHHLLVKTDDVWQQLDAQTLKPRPVASSESLRRLAQDAISSNSDRYGEVVSTKLGLVSTSTGVEIELDWNTMTFRQEGKDTRLINKFYQIHYLQWSGNDSMDKILAILGISLLLLLCWLGLSLSVNSRP